jgi:hypothetical protein
MVSNLSPKNILNKVADKIPCVKKIMQSKKLKKLYMRIKPIAKEALIILGITLAGAGFGALLGIPGGVAFVIIGASVGVTAGLLSYLAVRGVQYVLKHYGYPAHRHCTAHPISHEEKDRFTDIDKQKFNDILEDDFAPHAWFTQWKKQRGFAQENSKGSVENHLWRRLQKGFGHAESQCLLDVVNRFPQLEKEKVLQHFSTKNLFKKQLLELIRQDFERNKMQGAAQFRDEASLQEVIALSAKIKVHTADKPQMLTPTNSKLNSQELHNKHAFKAALSRSSFPNSLGKRPSFAILRLHNTKRFQTIFLQFEPGLRFYDAYSSHFTGLHEKKFKDENDFLDSLYSHVRGYYSRLRPLAPRFSSADIQWYYAPSPCTKAPNSPKMN